MAKTKRHFHAGKKTVVVNGVEFTSVRESNDRVFVSRNGTVITPMKDTPYKGTVLPNGYCEVSIKGFPVLVHRLVAEIFIRETGDGEEVDHIDANPGNNVLANLRIVTSEQNSQNDITYSRGCSARQGSLKKATESRLIPVVGVRLGREGVVGPFSSCRDAARKTGISHKAISNALRRVSLTAGGYVWISAREWKKMEVA